MTRVRIWLRVSLWADEPAPPSYLGSMNLIDTHCHLYMAPLDNDPVAVLARACARHVTQIIVPAYDQASWDLMAA